MIVGSAYMLALPSFAEPLLELLLADIDDVRTGSLVASVAILLFPVTFFGMYSPFAIRLMLRSAQQSGHGFGHGLWRVDLRLDRRHARHDLLS